MRAGRSLSVREGAARLSGLVAGGSCQFEAVGGESKRTDYACRLLVRNLFGRGFDSPRLHHSYLVDMVQLGVWAGLPRTFCVLLSTESAIESWLQLGLTSASKQAQGLADALQATHEIRREYAASERSS